MSKKANPTAIGMFLVLGLAMALGGVLLFGASKWFTHTEPYIIYFDGSVKGLNVGAPVKFSGVTVGSVREVLIRFNQKPNDQALPVIIELDEGLLNKKSDRTIQLKSDETLEAVILAGMRASLQAQSFVTGLLYVELEMMPGQPAPVFHQVKRTYKEIPSAPTKISQLLDSLAEVDVNGMASKFGSILDKMDSSLNSLHLEEISAGLTNVLNSLNTLVNTPQLTNSLVAVKLTLDEYRLLSETLRAKVDPLSKRADTTLEEAGKTLAQLQDAIQDLRGMLAPRGPLQTEVLNTLEELSQAAAAVGNLAEFLQRNPNALISGRPKNDANH